jgi:hypothetical protein
MGNSSRFRAPTVTSLVATCVPEEASAVRQTCMSCCISNANTVGVQISTAAGTRDRNAYRIDRLKTADGAIVDRVSWIANREAHPRRVAQGLGGHTKVLQQSTARHLRPSAIVERTWFPVHHRPLLSREAVSQLSTSCAWSLKRSPRVRSPSNCILLFVGRQDRPSVATYGSAAQSHAWGAGAGPLFQAVRVCGRMPRAGGGSCARSKRATGTPSCAGWCTRFGMSEHAGAKEHVRVYYQIPITDDRSGPAKRRTCQLRSRLCDDAIFQTIGAARGLAFTDLTRCRLEADDGNARITSPDRAALTAAEAGAQAGETKATSAVAETTWRRRCRPASRL